MNVKHKRYRKEAMMGPGGVNCPCCFPAPGSKARKAEFRRMKRVDDRNARREIEIELAVANALKDRDYYGY